MFDSRTFIPPCVCCWDCFLKGRVKLKLQESLQANKHANWPLASSSLLAG